MAFPSRANLVRGATAALLLLAHPGCSLLLDGDALQGAAGDAGTDAQADAAPSDVVEDPLSEPSADAVGDSIPDTPPDTSSDAPLDVTEDQRDAAPCTQETADCDGDADNGCETNVTVAPEHCGLCNHSCFGGQCEQGACLPVVIAEDQESPAAVVVDDASAQGRVYWTNRVEDGSVCSVSKTGGTVTVHAAQQVFPTGLAVDGEDVFWVASGVGTGAGTVASVNAGGGNVEVLVENQKYPASLTKAGNRLFWTNFDGAGSVWSYDTTTQAASIVSENEAFPSVIMRGDLRVWWGSVGGNAIYSANLSGTPPGRSLFLNGIPDPLVLAVDSAGVYWTEFTGAVKGATKLGKEVTIFATGQGTPSGIVVDGLYVYWASNSAGTIMRADRLIGADAGTPNIVTLASGQNGPAVLAQDNASLYWANGGDGSIMRLAK